jgi:hypothetical protein
MHSFLFNSPSYTSALFLLNCRRKGEERGPHPRGRKGGGRCCLFCSVYSLCLRVNPDAQPQHSRIVGGTDNTSVCDFVILLQLHRSVTCSDSLLSAQVSNCLPQYSDSSPAFVSFFYFFWLFVLELLLRRLICIACLLCFFSFFSHVLVFHLFWCDSSASSRLLVLLAGFFCVSVFEA